MLVCIIAVVSIVLCRLMAEIGGRMGVARWTPREAAQTEERGRV